MTLLALLLMLAALAGCETRTRVVRDGWASLRPLADAKPEPVDPDAPREAAQWTIELERYVGENRLAKAEALAAILRSEAGVPNVQVRDTGVAAIVSVGPVGDPNTPEAQATLERVRATAIDGMLPYRGAAWRPTGGVAGQQVYDPHDLRQFPGMYTLQIGFYDQRFGPNFRAAAEDAVRALRKAGDEAYFYHGPHLSIVTVGLFSYEEAFVTKENPLSPGTWVDAYSEAVRKLQEKYPYNLGNGLTLIEKVDGKTIGEQPSSLVRVPRR